jgi:hypothetical protein
MPVIPEPIVWRSGIPGDASAAELAGVPWLFAHALDAAADASSRMVAIEIRIMVALLS